MTRASLLCIAAVLFGCAPDLTNGGLRCSAKNECPSGYHCAVDETCWRNGEDPAVADLSATPEPDGGGLDLSTAPDLAVENGQPCSNPSQCGSGNCADGVCCDEACTESCRSCNQLGHVGVCTDVANGAMPAHPGCTTDVPTSCGEDGTCDGMGLCRKYGSDTVCEGASCTGNSAIPVSKCNGAGTCIPSPATNCAPYLCANNVCSTSCGDAMDCIPGDICAAGTCMVK